MLNRYCFLAEVQRESGNEFEAVTGAADSICRLAGILRVQVYADDDSLLVLIEATKSPVAAGTVGSAAMSPVDTARAIGRGLEESGLFLRDSPAIYRLDREVNGSSADASCVIVGRYWVADEEVEALLKWQHLVQDQVVELSGVAGHRLFIRDGARAEFMVVAEYANADVRSAARGLVATGHGLVERRDLVRFSGEVLRR